MPQGEPYTSPDDLPAQFDTYSKEAQLAALDAYNGAIADGVPTGRAFELAHEAATSIDQAEERGVSDELARQPQPPAPRQQAGPAPMPMGPGAGGGSIAQALTL